MSRKIKIATVVPKYGMAGGAEQFVFELTERIAQNNCYDLHVFANQWRAGSSPVTFHKVPIIRFPKWLATPSFAFFANKKIASFNFDIIHTHDRIFTADICTLHSVPHKFWVKKIRHKKFLSLFDRATVYTEKRLFNSSQCHIFMPVSNLAKEILLNEFPQLKKKTRVLCPGVNLDKYCPTNSARKSESAFGFSPDDFVLLFVGMNFELKGLDPVMAALCQSQQKSPRPLKLLVAGKGDIEKYTKLATKLNIKNNVVFAGTRDDMENIYSEGDMLIMLSQFDTFGMVVLEAMANSLPVIISSNVGAQDLVEDGKNGFIVGRNDIGVISEKILMVLNDTTYSQIASEAKKTAIQHSWDIKASFVEAIYQDLIERKVPSVK